MAKEELKTKEEARAYILGIITGLNSARLSVWGIGFDSDETARFVRKYTSDEIFKQKELLEIDNFGDSLFGSAESLLKK